MLKYWIEVFPVPPAGDVQSSGHGLLSLPSSTGTCLSVDYFGGWRLQAALFIIWIESYGHELSSLIIRCTKNVFKTMGDNKGNLHFVVSLKCSSLKLYPLGTVQYTASRSLCYVWKYSLECFIFVNTVACEKSNFQIPWIKVCHENFGKYKTNL